MVGASAIEGRIVDALRAWGRLIPTCAYNRPALLSCAEPKDPDSFKKVIINLFVGHALARARRAANPEDDKIDYPGSFDHAGFSHVNAIVSRETQRKNSQITLIRIVDMAFALHEFNECYGVYEPLSGDSFLMHHPNIEVKKRFAELADCAANSVSSRSSELLEKLKEIVAFLELSTKGLICITRHSGLSLG